MWNFFSTLDNGVDRKILEIKFNSDSNNKIVDDFFTEIDAYILPFDSEHTNHVIDAYFNRATPFSDKKKTEFPDAFALISLKNFCKSEKQHMVIVGSDPDWGKFVLNNNSDVSWLFFEKIEDAINDQVTKNRELSFRAGKAKFALKHKLHFDESRYKNLFNKYLDDFFKDEQGFSYLSSFAIPNFIGYHDYDVGSFDFLGISVEKILDPINFNTIDDDHIIVSGISDYSVRLTVIFTVTYKAKLDVYLLKKSVNIDYDSGKSITIDGDGVGKISVTYNLNMDPAMANRFSDDPPKNIDFSQTKFNFLDHTHW